jgi:serine/threonine-protein kinase
MRPVECGIWDLLDRSRLLSPPELSEARAKAARFGRDDVSVAIHLAESGLITPWQSLQLLAGRTSFSLGAYRLLDCIGSGGAATIYKARHHKTGSTLALKVLCGADPQHPMAQARFRREARAAAAVKHPHIVATYGGQCIDGVRFLTMEYVDGEDLDRWLKRFDSLPLEWCCEVARQAALGLEHIHRHAIVHRDVKPSNLLLVARASQEPPLVKIADLGAACMKSPAGECLTPLTTVNQFLGTPNFVAPEQVLNARDVDHRADIFSLGCTLFKLLTYTIPWQGATVAEKLLARTRQDAPRASRFRGEIPQGLDDLIARMLARRPDQRFASAREVAQALAPFTGRAGPTFRQPGAALASPPKSHAAALDGAAMWRLERCSATGLREAYPLGKTDRLVVGRAPDCDIQVKDLQVSRRHCLLIYQNSRWVLEDLGSNNGTLVNGVKIERAELKEGDEFRLGGTTLALVMRRSGGEAWFESSAATTPPPATVDQLLVDSLAGLALTGHGRETIHASCDNDTSQAFPVRKRVRFGRRR